jgi:hypothetical protein
MLTAFWETVGGKLADRWAAVSVPALVFWLGGLAAWIYDRGGLHSLSSQTGWLERQTPSIQVVVVLIGLLAVAASAALVNRVAAPALRLLEGYWPSWSAPLRRRLAGWLVDRATAEAVDWQRAYAAVRPPNTPTAEQLATYARLERRRRRRPADPAYFLPTPIGNILRAAERRPVDKYGMDTISLWPRLWLLLPDATRQELLAARASLDNAVDAAIWGLLFCAFAPFTALAIPVGLAVTAVAIIAVLPGRAQVFGDLIEAAYDLHRNALYQQLRWPLPTNPEHEHDQGSKLTEYLQRGSDDITPTFTPDMSDRTTVGSSGDT